MEKNKCGNRYSPEVRERAVRMVFEHQGDFVQRCPRLAEQSDHPRRQYLLPQRVLSVVKKVHGLRQHPWAGRITWHRLANSLRFLKDDFRMKEVYDACIQKNCPIRGAEILQPSTQRRVCAANASDQIWRNLMEYPLYLSGPQTTAGIESLREATFGEDRTAWWVNIGSEGWNFAVGDPWATACDFIGAKVVLA